MRPHCARGLMGGLFILAIYFGRRSTAYVSLCASALFMTLLNPLTLWDIGFQLSFMATLGLILFTPVIEGQFQRVLARGLTKERMRRVMGILNDALIVTLAAQVTTLPVIVYYFGRISLISLVTNFFILPAQPPIMTGGMATLVAGLAWEPLARGLASDPLAVSDVHHRGRAADRGRAIRLGGNGRVWVVSPPWSTWPFWSVRCSGASCAAAAG